MAPPTPPPPPSSPPAPPSLCSCVISRSRDLGQGQAGPGQGQTGRPRARAQRTTGSAWAAPPHPILPDPQHSQSLSSALSHSLLPGTVSPKNFKVKMIMKTSVLLSWEFPDNYNSPTPYKVTSPATSGAKAQSGVGAWSRVRGQLDPEPRGIRFWLEFQI